MSAKRPTISRQNLAGVSANTIFLACNFQNFRVKRHFDRLKKAWEDTLPVRVYLSDQVRGAGARDLWQDISTTIRQANLAIFDLTAYRPNVVLELGYGLACLEDKQIVICRDLTPEGKRSRGKKRWEISDIAHLHRVEYKTFARLDRALLEHVERMAPVRNFYRVVSDIESASSLSTKLYVAVSIEALKKLRDDGPMRRSDFSAWLRGRKANAKVVERLLKIHKLAKPSAGKNGSWKLID